MTNVSKTGARTGTGARVPKARQSAKPVSTPLFESWAAAVVPAMPAQRPYAAEVAAGMLLQNGVFWGRPLRPVLIDVPDSLYEAAANDKGIDNEALADFCAQFRSYSGLVVPNLAPNPANHAHMNYVGSVATAAMGWVLVNAPSVRVAVTHSWRPDQAVDLREVGTGLIQLRGNQDYRTMFAEPPA